MKRYRIHSAAHLLACWAFVPVWLGSPASSSAQPCNSQPVAQNDFVEHFGGTVVVDVLANDTEPDGEALSVTSLTTTCAGTVSADLGLVIMASTSAGTEDCTISYRARDERGLSSAPATVVISRAASLFADGFETGDTSRWTGEAGS